MRLFAVMFVCLSSLVALARPASADTLRYSLRGDNASGFCEVSDGCSVTSVSFYASDSIQRENGTSTPTESATVYLTEYNLCTGEYRFGFATGDASTFSINHLSSASVSMSVDLFRYVFDPVTGEYTQEPAGTSTVDMSLTADGDIINSQFVSHESGGPYFINSRYHAQQRDAAVSETITIDGAPVLGMSCDAYLYDINTGYRQVTTL